MSEGYGKEAHAELADTVRRLEHHRSGVVLSGRIKDGKVELDESTLRALESKFAGADRAFVAVNAPFDPGSQPA